MGKTCQATTAKGTQCQCQTHGVDDYCGKHLKKLGIKRAAKPAGIPRARPSTYQIKLDEFKANNPIWSLEDIESLCQMEIDWLGTDSSDSGKRQNWARIAADVAKSIEARGTLIDDKLEVHIHVPQNTGTP